MYNNEIAFHNHDKAIEVAKALINEGYVVLLSADEDLVILNYEWSEHFADRNDVIFMSRNEFDEKYYKIIKEED